MQALAYQERHTCFLASKEETANRLVLTLLWQARRHGRRQSDDIISLLLSQKDLTNLVGASRAAVADQIGKFKKERLLETSY